MMGARQSRKRSRRTGKFPLSQSCCRRHSRRLRLQVTLHPPRMACRRRKQLHCQPSKLGQPRKGRGDLDSTSQEVMSSCGGQLQVALVSSLHEHSGDLF